jgi:hypothetical protein
MDEYSNVLLGDPVSNPVALLDDDVCLVFHPRLFRMAVDHDGSSFALVIQAVGGEGFLPRAAIGLSDAQVKALSVYFLAEENALPAGTA